jgi:hypothetical protein
MSTTNILPNVFIKIDEFAFIFITKKTKCITKKCDLSLLKL